MHIKNVKGLEHDFRKKVCGVGNKEIKRCRFLQYVSYKGELYLVCGKNTAGGIKHSAKIDKLMRENPDGKLPTDGGALEIIGSDNCPGRAGEFAHLFEKKTN
ncbi:MAG: hypothetical protein V1661_00425 [bacterium]